MNAFNPQGRAPIVWPASDKKSTGTLGPYSFLNGKESLPKGRSSILNLITPIQTCLKRKKSRSANFLRFHHWTFTPRLETYVLSGFPFWYLPWSDSSLFLALSALDCCFSFFRGPQLLPFELKLSFYRTLTSTKWSEIRSWSVSSLSVFYWST